MIGSIPAEIAAQVSQICDLIVRRLTSGLQAIHLYGSALDGGLKPHSDIDLLVTVESRLDEATRRSLSLDLLKCSAPPGVSPALRALEVTVVVRDEVVPWGYPARRELQFGEWLRADILSGVFAPAVLDADLAILLTKARQHSVALLGASAREIFDPVPSRDFYKVLAETLTQWSSPSDWEDDERNVVLTLAHIWYSAETGGIAPKDVAADWVLERLPAEYRPVLLAARQAYRGAGEDDWVAHANEIAAFIRFAKSVAGDLLARHQPQGVDPHLR